MAINLFELVGSITVKYKDALDGMDKVTDKAKSTGGEVGKLGDQAEKSGGRLSGFFALAGEAAVKMAGFAVQATKAGAAAVTTITGLAVKEFASYEQLTGGVETLFNKAYDSVMKNADKAYKTAGLSANAYMETVTSFSASLIQGLQGDTEQAAKVADIAIVDMADNVNKMGSSMESVQNAYNGFAKGNFTMLDNLKLGYGGTQAEMIRLINDSGILNKKIEDLDNVTFDQMIMAIHEVQEKLGIAGATAAEAEGTIEGSANAMKAAWTNVLTGLSRSDGNLKNLLKTAISTTETFGNNIIPRIQTTLANIGQAVETVAPIILQKIPEMVVQIGPGLISATGSLLRSVITTIMQYGPEIIQSAKDTAIGFMNSLGAGLKENIPLILEQALPLVLSFAETLREGAGQLVDAGLNLIMNIANGIIDSIPTLLAYIPDIIINIAGIINDNMPKIVATGASIILSLVTGLINNIPNIVAAIPKIISAIVSVWTAFNWLDLGKTVVTKIKNGLQNLPASAKTLFTNAVDGMKSVFSNGATVLLNTAKNIGTGVLNAIKSMVSNLKSALNFSWSLPKLKMPHFSISGSFSLNPPSVPRFGIEWYQKAMEEGMVMSSPQIFGFDPKSNKFLAGGEAGEEAVVGTRSLREMVREAANEGKNEMIELLRLLLQAIKDLDKNLYNKMIKALESMQFRVSEREFARLVKAVE